MDCANSERSTLHSSMISSLRWIWTQCIGIARCVRVFAHDTFGRSLLIVRNLPTI
jgi:hypothetical protein